MKHLKKLAPMFLLACLACLCGGCLAFAAEVTAVATPTLADGSPLDFIVANKAVLLTALLALSEVLALIPGIKANSIFEAVVNGLKAIAGNQAPPATGR